MVNLKNLQHFFSQNSSLILQTGAPWSKFILLKPGDKDYESTKQLLLNHENIKQILSLLEDQEIGINSLNNNPADFRLYNSFYWTLRFLADIGIFAEELGINHLIQRLMLQQSEDGQFIIRYYKKRQQEISLICMTAHLTYCLTRLGFQNSPTTEAAIKHIISSQRKDGGWHCKKLHQNGERDENLPSCPAANIHVFRLLGQFGKKYESNISAIKDTILVSYNSTKADFCNYTSEQNINYSKLRYPPHFTGLDILNLINSLSYLPNISLKKYFNKLINNVLRRWDGMHFLCSEKRIPAWSSFDFGHNNKGSDWITAIFLSALKRAYLKK
ncbi:hypothetical protein ISS22_04680 [candidate division KSB1 bacterium]|nr:hypothetical protein [candidate division KSB1 bacterium]